MRADRCAASAYAFILCACNQGWQAEAPLALKNTWPSRQRGYKMTQELMLRKAGMTVTEGAS